MFWLIMETEQIKCEGQAVQCRIWSLQREMYAKDVNQQRVEPAVIDAINKITLVKSSMEFHLPLCRFIAKMQCLPVLLEICDNI